MESGPQYQNLSGRRHTAADNRPAVFKTVCGAPMTRPGWVRFPSIPAKFLCDDSQDDSHSGGFYLDARWRAFHGMLPRSSLSAPPPVDRAGERRSRLQLAFVIIACVWTPSLLVELAIRAAFNVGEAHWVVDPWLYVARSEHSVDGESLHVALTLALLIFGLVILVAVVHRVRSGSIVPTVAVACLVSGQLANASDVLVRGSVIDVVGLHMARGGIYSVGDIAISTGFALVPSAAMVLVARDTSLPGSVGVCIAVLTLQVALAMSVVEGGALLTMLSISATVVSVIGFFVRFKGSLEESG